MLIYITFLHSATKLPSCNIISWACISILAFPAWLEKIEILGTNVFSVYCVKSVKNKPKKSCSATVAVWKKMQLFQVISKFRNVMCTLESKLRVRLHFWAVFLQDYFRSFEVGRYSLSLLLEVSKRSSSSGSASWKSCPFSFLLPSTQQRNSLCRVFKDSQKVVK